eukprot:2419560-Prymnesium_polylepis.2
MLNAPTARPTDLASRSMSLIAYELLDGATMCAAAAMPPSASRPLMMHAARARSSGAPTLPGKTTYARPGAIESAPQRQTGTPGRTQPSTLARRTPRASTATSLE